MPRENSFSDSDGRSLTPDLSEAEEEEHEINTHNTDNRPPSSPVSPISASAAPLTGGHPLTHFATTNTVYDIKKGTRYENDGGREANVFPSRPSAGTSMASAPAGPSLPPSYPGTSTARFRTAVRRVILSRRMSSAVGATNGPGAGAEPGVDPRRDSAYINYGHLSAKCAIQVIDYSGIRSSSVKMGNEEFLKILEDEKGKREPWSRVRWINIGGISWDVMSSLSLKYGIHPLALEDVLHQRPQARSKADYYLKHLFIRILVHQLAPEDSMSDSDNDASAELEFGDIPRSMSPDAMENADLSINSKYKTSKCHEIGVISDAKDEGRPKIIGNGRSSGLSSRFLTNSLRRANFFSGKGDLEAAEAVLKKVSVHQPSPPQRGRSKTSANLIAKTKFRSPSKANTKSRKAVANARTIEVLKRGQRVNVRCWPLFLFLYRDGTVISISPIEDLIFTAPITARLRQRDTGLRSTADPSLLIQSLLDLVVDQALDVVDEYQRRILQLEHDILIKPKVKTVRFLHILSGDLTLHKRTLQPIKTLVYGLRRYDVDRCNALLDSVGSDKPARVEGFMSHKSKIYLADVHDHMDYVLTSLDMFYGVTENLINYTFNMSSSEMNETMRRLTLATITCLPLTLLTGYFGMNFQSFWSIHNNSDLFFWEIAIPLIVVVIGLFLFDDFTKLVHYVKKRRVAHKVTEEVVLEVRGNFIHV